MTTEITFRVHGIPAPQGSKKAFQRGTKIVLVEQSARTLVPWRTAVREAAVAHRQKHDIETLEGPLALSVTFLMPRPASVKPAKRPYPHVTPDLSKLIRGLEDAITESGLWRDDCQVVLYRNVGKLYANEDVTGSPGAIVTISKLT